MKIRTRSQFELMSCTVSASSELGVRVWHVWRPERAVAFAKSLRELPGQTAQISASRIISTSPILDVEVLA